MSIRSIFGHYTQTQTFRNCSIRYNMYENLYNAIGFEQSRSFLEILCENKMFRYYSIHTYIFISAQNLSDSGYLKTIHVPSFPKSFKIFDRTSCHNNTMGLSFSLTKTMCNPSCRHHSVSTMTTKHELADMVKQKF